jgi:membrane-associated phospholipid phosphatase
MSVSVFHEFGQYSPLLLFFLSIYLLWDQSTLLFYYIIGIFMNTILNLILKGIFQQPRPLEDITKFKMAITRGSRYLFKNGIPFDIYGMPSGHAQTILFSTTFIYFSLHQQNILYLYLGISIITMIHRLIFKYHTVIQVLIGAVVGIMMGYFVYFLAKTKLKRKLTIKLDDFNKAY